MKYKELYLKSLEEATKTEIKHKERIKRLDVIIIGLVLGNIITWFLITVIK